MECILQITVNMYRATVVQEENLTVETKINYKPAVKFNRQEACFLTEDKTVTAEKIFSANT